MIPIFVSILFGLLGLLIQWLSSRQSLTPEQKEKLEHVLYRMTQVRAQAATMDCNPNGTPAPEDAPGVTMAGWNPLDRIYDMIGTKLAARVRTLLPTFPGTEDEQKAFFADQVREVVNS